MAASRTRSDFRVLDFLVLCHALADIQLCSYCGRDFRAPNVLAARRAGNLVPASGEEVFASRAPIFLLDPCCIGYWNRLAKLCVGR